MFALSRSKCNTSSDSVNYAWRGLSKLSMAKFVVRERQETSLEILLINDNSHAFSNQEVMF